MMWDEQQFFEDFVKDTDRIKPDAAFIEQLKEQINQDNVVRLKKRKRTQYMAVAASLLLCISTAGIGWNIFAIKQKNPGQNEDVYQGQLSAGKEEEKVSSGEVGENDSILLDVISMVEDETNLLDNEQGVSLSTQERKKLVEMLKNSEKIKNSVEISAEEFSNNSIVYYCVSDETVKITVYEEKYIMIGDAIYIVKR